MSETGFDQSLAVVIGIDDYGQGVPPLRTATNDARRVAQILERDHGYQVGLLVENVSKARLEKLFVDLLPDRVGPEDRLLVYFAGHGIALEGEDGPAGYLIPQDARFEDRGTFLPMAEFHGWLMALCCRHMLAILDCCFAGAFRWASMRSLLPLPAVIHQERYERFVRDPAWQVLTSAAYDQRALDELAGDTRRGLSEEGGRLHSPFAQALFEALAGAGDVVPKGEGDGVITATELYLYLRDSVEVKAAELAWHEQTPGIWPLKKHDKGEFIFLVPGHELNLPPAPELTFDNNPYRGLQSYDEEHGPLFFGREEEVEELSGLVAGQPLTVVLGASGTGKSSLVKAGLLPHQRRMGQASAGSEAEHLWSILPPLRPTSTPLAALSHLLAEHLPAYRAAADLGRLLDDSGALADLVGAWKRDHAGQKLLLVVDQLEELVTLCGDEVERAQFLALLAGAIEGQPDAFRLVVTLRTDFEPQFTAEGPLAELWPGELVRYVVPPLDHEDLRQVIEGPATERVLYFEPYGLVDDLIREVIQTPGALPLLSFTLSELYIRYLKRQDWARRSGESIDRSLLGADYRHLGGVVGSLRTRATEEYEDLPDDAHRETMRRVMLRMVSVEGGELAGRRVPRTELVYAGEAENDRVEEVVRRLVAARLVVRGREEGGEAYVEPAHDALVRAWDKLLVWTGEAGEYLPLQRRLAQASTEWERAGEKERTGLLWDGDPRLPQVEDLLWPAARERSGLVGWLRWLKHSIWPNVTNLQDTAWLNGREVGFVQQSVARRARVLQRIVVITLAVILALSGLTLFAFGQQSRAEQSASAEATAAALAQDKQAEAEQSAQAEATAAALAREKQAEAEREAQIARAGQLAANSKAELAERPRRSLLLAVEAVSVTLPVTVPRVAAAEQSLRDVLSEPWGLSLPGHEGGIYSLAVSPTGRWLVTGSGSGGARLWDMEAPDPGASPLILRGHQGPVESLAISPDGRWLATGSYDIARLWDVSALLSTDLETATDPAASEPAADSQALRGHESGIYALAGSPDGRWLATAGADATIRLWDVSALLSAGLETATDPAGSLILRGHEGAINSLAISPDGRWLAAGSEEGTTWLWDVSTVPDTGPEADAPLALRGHQGTIFALAFSPDGRWLATGSRDATARLWDVSAEPDTGLEAADPASDSWILRGHEGVIFALAISPDGRWLATASADGTARLWDVSAVFSTGLDAADPTIDPLVLRGHEGNLEALAISPDGRWLATGGYDKTVRLWDVSAVFSTGLEAPDPSIGSLVLRGHEGLVGALAFSPDGRWLASGSYDTARLWDVSTLLGARLQSSAEHSADPLVLRGHEEAVTALAISPDGRWLATGSYDATVRLWDASTLLGMGLEAPDPLVLRGHESVVFVLAISPDGRWLASGSEDATVRVWDLSALLGTGLEATAPLVLRGHEGSILALAISPDGRWLVTRSSDGTVNLWDVSAALEPGREAPDPLVLRGQQGWGGALAISPDGRWLATGNYGGTARLWDVSAVLNTGLEAATEPAGSEPGADPLVLRGHESDVSALAISPDGRWLATGSRDSTARLWDVSAVLNTGLEAPEAGAEPMVLRGHEGEVTALAISPDGRWLATGSEDGAARLWDLEAADPGSNPLLLRGHESTVGELAISPDGRWLVTGSWDHTARLWDLEAADPGADPLVLRGHEGTINELAVSPDGRWLATGSNDGTARLWRLQTDELLEVACRVVGRNLTQEEWLLYFRGQEYRGTCDRFPVHTVVIRALLDDGKDLARGGDVQGAMAKFEEALRLDPSLEIDPEGTAKQSRAEALVDDGTSLARLGKIESAIARFKEARGVNPNLEIDAASWNTLCWYGSIYGHAEQVLPACEDAVRLAKDKDLAGCRDSRGLARALTGDYAGAIEDFQYYVGYSGNSASIPSRQAWIAELEAGRNPIDEATLEALRNQ